MNVLGFWELHMIRHAVLLFAAAVAHGSGVVELTPESWARRVPGRQWLVYFAVTGCKHCERLAPMMEYVATQAPELRVGRVNASEYNGIPRTFEVTKFPFILLFDSNNVVYEFHGTRSPPRLIAIARGDPTLLGAGRPAPTQLKDNVSDWWLLAEAFWGPLKTAATWSLGITLSLKLCATGALRLLRRPPKDPKAKPPEKAS